MDNLINDSLFKYFKILSAVGELPYSEVSKLVLLLHINKLITLNTQDFISKEDNQILKETLINLTKSACILPCDFHTVKLLGSM